MRPYFLWICISLLAQSVVAQTCRDDIPTSTPDSRFTVNGEEVIDHVTGLVWQRCSLGQAGSDCSGGGADAYTWQGALQAAEVERTATGVAWRLPNRNELQSIVERRCFRPAINASVFPNTHSWYYWSGSPNAKFELRVACQFQQWLLVQLR